MFIYSTYFEGNFQIMRIPLLFIIAKINFLFHMLAIYTTANRVHYSAHRLLSIRSIWKLLSSVRTQKMV